MARRARDSAWKRRKFEKEWSQSDTLNATIGQGYVQVSPLQLAVLAARVASGKMLLPYLIEGQQKPIKPLNIPPEHLAVVREGMDLVVMARHVAQPSARLDNIHMAGRRGPRRSARLQVLSEVSQVRKYRDHGLSVSSRRWTGPNMPVRSSSSMAWAARAAAPSPRA